MKIFFSIIYIISLCSGLYIFFNYVFPDLLNNTGSMPVISILLTIFLFIFGIYGFIGERLLTKLKRQNSGSIEVAASYYIRKKGALGKLLLFPFIHIKSRYSFVIAFFGSLVWIIILMIIYFGIITKVFSL